MPPFFSYTSNALNVQRATDIAYINHFANTIYEGQVPRVIYAENAYCFRRRTDERTGVLDIPFMNIYCKNWEYDYTNAWYTFPADKKGLWLEDILTQLHLTPMKMTYEATLWFERDDDLKAVLNRLIRYRQNHVYLAVPMDIYNEDRSAKITMNNTAMLNFDTLGVATDFMEKDWLEKNQIRGITADFSVYTFAMEATHDAVCIPDSVIFEFASHFTNTEDMTYNDVHNFVIDHVLNTVTEV